MKVKEESEKVGLKLNVQKTKIMISCPITSWQIDGERVEMKKEFIGPGLHLRPVCADRAWPPLQGTLSSVLSACGNDKGRIRPPSGQGSLEEEKTDTNHPCLRTVSIGM